MKTQLQPNQISHCEADVNYTTLHFIDGRREVFAYTLKKFEQLLSPHAFVRINKSFLINTSLVISVQTMGRINEVLLSNGLRILSSRRKRKVLEQWV